MSETKHRIIAVDFDGCLCENRWPDIGDDNPEAVRAVLQEQAAGSKIILWTCRTGELLDNALAWCERRGIHFDAVNEHLPELKDIYGNDTRKVFADEYWDDRAVRMPRLHPLNELARDIHQNAVAHGWWDEPRSFGDIVALCHSELSEALEEFRGGRPMVYGCCGYCEHDENCDWENKDKTQCKPEGIAVEMLDCLIRILDWCAKEGVDVDGLLRIKHEYNKTRPYRHGGKAL